MACVFIEMFNILKANAKKQIENTSIGVLTLNPMSKVATPSRRIKELEKGTIFWRDRSCVSKLLSGTNKAERARAGRIDAVQSRDV